MILFNADIWNSIMSYFHSSYRKPYHYNAMMQIATFTHFRSISYSQKNYSYYEHIQKLLRHYNNSPKWLKSHSIKPDIILHKTNYLTVE